MLKASGKTRWKDINIDEVFAFMGKEGCEVVFKTGDTKAMSLADDTSCFRHTGKEEIGFWGWWADPYLYKLSKTNQQLWKCE